MSIITRILATIAIAAFSVGPVSAATAQNATTLVAQASAGSITGTAVDETGAPIVGATVTVRGPQTYTGTTDAKGAFTISNIAPALYTIIVRKNGYDTASQPDFAVFAGEAASVAITMHTSTLTTLQTIATVRTAGRGTINTSTAATNSVTSATFENQGAPQVIRTLNQVPGVQISLPQSNANGGSPGAITFPNIRGALSFETASLIDGHPLSVGTFGDYVTTFLSPYMFQGVDVIKGPGAMAPQVNYAIGGTVNFRTKDPTATVTPEYTFGLDNHGGTFFNLGVSDTLGKLGFVVDVSGTNIYGNINNYQATVNPTGAYVNGKPLAGSASANGYVPGTASQITNQYGLTACCIALNGTFQGTNELLKVRYKFSDATTATVSYLGSQTLSDQNANIGSLNFGMFCPANTGSKLTADPVTFAPTYTPGTCTQGVGAKAYTGTTGVGSPVAVANIFPVYNREINNEPILQAELRTTLGNDTILGRFYHAGIQRLKREGGSDPTIPTTVSMTLNGVDATQGSFNNQLAQVSYFDWFNSPEIDSLNGVSLEYSHPFGESNDLSLGVDQTRSTTVSYSQFPLTNGLPALGTSVSVPGGSSQNFTTAFGRLRMMVGPKLSGTMTLYSNNYQTTYLQGCYTDTTFTTATGCKFDVTANPIASAANNPNYVTATRTHFDERLGLEYRPSANLATRFSMGSAIAPPYLFLFQKFATQPVYHAGNTFVLANFNGTNPYPETSFGYDLGADYRLKDGITVVSGDVYTTTLYNQIITGVDYQSPFTCGTYPGGCGGGAPANIPVVYSANTNLNNARYSGAELTVKRAPAVGWGYSVAGAVLRAYPYNIPPCFYSTAPATQCGAYNQLLGVVPNNNFTGGSPTQGFATFGFTGVSNQNVPNFQGNLELNYNWKNGAYVAIGDTFYGKNNSLNEPPFGIGYASVRVPISHSLSVQISGDNIFNAYPNLFPSVGQGVAVPLASAPTLVAGNAAGYVSSGLPAQGATTAGNLGPATWRFIITKNIGPEPVNSPNP